MFVNTFFRRVLFNLLGILIVIIFCYFMFKNLYLSDEVIVSFAVHPFNICEKYSKAWYYIKLLYIPITLISSIICINILYSSFFKKSKKEIVNTKIPDLHLEIFNEDKTLIIPETGLYQNFLVTGTIGSGKTSCIMYPLTKQLIKYKCKNLDKKLGMLILDVKGNYYSRVKKYAEYYGRSEDLIVIEIRPEILSITRYINQILSLQFWQIDLKLF